MANESTSSFELVFEGPVDGSPDTLRKIKGVFIADFELSIPEVQDILQRAPVTVRMAPNAEALEKYKRSLSKAGAKVLVVCPASESDERSEAEEDGFEFEVDLSEGLDRKPKSRETSRQPENRVYHLDLKEDPNQADEPAVLPIEEEKTFMPPELEELVAQAGGDADEEASGQELDDSAPIVLRPSGALSTPITLAQPTKLDAKEPLPPPILPPQILSTSLDLVSETEEPTDYEKHQALKTANLPETPTLNVSPEEELVIKQKKQSLRDQPQVPSEKVASHSMTVESEATPAVEGVLSESLESTKRAPDPEPDTSPLTFTFDDGTEPAAEVATPAQKPLTPSLQVSAPLAGLSLSLDEPTEHSVPQAVETKENQKKSEPAQAALQPQSTTSSLKKSVEPDLTFSLDEVSAEPAEPEGSDVAVDNLTGLSNLLSSVSELSQRSSEVPPIKATTNNPDNLSASAEAKAETPATAPSKGATSKVSTTPSVPPQHLPQLGKTKAAQTKPTPKVEEEFDLDITAEEAPPGKIAPPPASSTPPTLATEATSGSSAAMKPATVSEKLATSTAEKSDSKANSEIKKDSAIKKEESIANSIEKLQQLKAAQGKARDRAPVRGTSSSAKEGLLTKLQALKTKLPNQETMVALAIAALLLGAGNWWYFSSGKPAKTALPGSHSAKNGGIVLSPDLLLPEDAIAPSDTPVIRSEPTGPAIEYTSQESNGGLTTTVELKGFKGFIKNGNLTITTPKPASLTAEEIAAGMTPRLWLFRAEIQELSITQEPSGSFVGKGPARLFIEKGRSRLRQIGSALVRISFPLNDEKARGYLEISNVADLSTFSGNPEAADYTLREVSPGKFEFSVRTHFEASPSAVVTPVKSPAKKAKKVEPAVAPSELAKSS